MVKVKNDTTTTKKRKAAASRNKKVSSKKAAVVKKKKKKKVSALKSMIGKNNSKRSNRLIANSALKDVFKRQGSYRVREGALDSIPGEAEQYIYELVSAALRSMVMAKRKTCQAVDVDVALAARGEACY